MCEGNHCLRLPLTTASRVTHALAQEAVIDGRTVTECQQSCQPRMPGVHAWRLREADLLFPLGAFLLSHAHLSHASSGLLMLVMSTSTLSHHFSLVQPYFSTPTPLFRAESHKPWSSSPTSTRNASQIFHMFTIRPGTSKFTDHDSIELTTF